MVLQLKDKHDKEDKASNQRKKAFMAGKVHGVSYPVLTRESS